MAEENGLRNWLYRQMGIPSYHAAPAPAALSDPIGAAREGLGIDATAPPPVPNLPQVVAPPLPVPQPGQVIGGGQIGNPPGLGFNGPLPQQTIPPNQTNNPAPVPQASPAQVSTGPNFNAAGMAGLLNAGPLNLAPITGQIMQAAMSQGANDAYQGTPLQITNGRRQETTWPGGAYHGQDQYGDLRSFNPLRFIEQASQQIQQQHQGNLGIPLDQANQLAARDVSQLYNGVVPEFMRYQLGAGDLGIRGIQQSRENAEAYGYGGVMGRIATNALNAHTNAYNAQNTPRAEDAQADATAMAEYNRLIAQGLSPGANGEAIATMRRTQQRLPRQFGGSGGNGPPLTAIPSWYGGTGQPSGPTVTNGTNTTNADTTTTGSQQPGRTPAMERIAVALDRARAGVPTTPGVVGQNGVIGPAVPQPYAPANAAAYHAAITAALSGISDQDYTMANFPHIADTLREQFGGPNALNGWLQQNYYTNPLTNNSISTNPQSQEMIRQIQRYQQLHGIRPGRATYGTPLDMLLRVLPASAIPNWLVGR